MKKTRTKGRNKGKSKKQRRSWKKEPVMKDIQAKRKQRKGRRNPVKVERRHCHELSRVWRWRLALDQAEVDTGTGREEGGARAGELSPVWRALDRHIVADRELNPL